MLMGFQLNTLEEALQPRNPRNGHTWAYPPAIILRTLQDEASVIERVNRTLDALQAQAGISLFQQTMCSLCSPMRSDTEAIEVQYRAPLRMCT